MDATRFLTDVGARAQLSPTAAAAAVEACLCALGDELRRFGAVGFAARLPEELAEFVDPRPPHGHVEDDLARFFEGISRRLPDRALAAVEQGRVVCSVLAEYLDAATLEELHEGLPKTIARLFEVVERSTSRPISAAPPGSLAAGRPGGTRPIAEASLEFGHRDSVARSDDPRGDRKMSAAGEVEADTLSTGKAGSGRPLAGGR